MSASEVRLQKRKIGAFYTPEGIFDKYILPKIETLLWEYTWIDLYCGKGDLIIPIVKCINENKRDLFVEQHIKCFDIDEKALSIFKERLRNLNVKEEVIERSVVQMDTLEKFPDFSYVYPLYHITNPPYLYRGFIPKTEKTRELLKYFQGEREQLQDLYQVALFNDVKKGIEKMIYIIPTNFLFGDANANYIRNFVLTRYRITHLYILEEKVFPDTGTNTCICFFEKKTMPSSEDQVVDAIKVSKGEEKHRIYRLTKKFKWRAGSEFYEFVEKFRAKTPIRFKFYLTKKEIEVCRGEHTVALLDVNHYQPITVSVNKQLYDKIKSNILFLKTLDTGRFEGRAGLYEHREIFNVDGIMVSKDYTYRTHPIQIFFENKLTPEEQKFVKHWFNILLNKLRTYYDSDFMTTYRENTQYYTRKYLGIKQARMLLETCPLLDLEEKEKAFVLKLAKSDDIENLKRWIEKYLSAVEEKNKHDVKGQSTLLEFISKESRAASRRILFD